MPDALQLPFVQRGLAEVLLLAVAAGAIGTWIVLRGLAFHAHAVGSATFPGLVLAAGVGLPAPLAAAGAAGVFTALVAFGSRRPGDDRGAVIALALVALLALGVILASDVFASPASIESLLFGSLLLVDPGDLALAGALAAASVAGTMSLGRRWLAAGFEGAAEGIGGVAHRGPDLVLLALVAVAVVASLTAVGALLVATVLVIPAATTRLLCERTITWQLATGALAALEGVVAVLLSVELNAPPGATMAALSALVFAGVAAGRAVWRPDAARRRYHLLAGTALGLFVAGAAGCGGDSDSNQLRVVATTPIVADLVNEVGGDGVDVHAILTPNTDPHEYEPRPDDVQATADAEVMFASGGDLDHWAEELIADSGSSAELIELDATVPVTLPDDPHWWQDPGNAMAAVREIRDRLVDADPAAGDEIEANAAAYLRRLRRLDTGTERCIDSIPRPQRKLVTDHDAFGYFAERYGLEVVGTVIPALTTEAQPSARDLAELRATIERERVRAVFPEESVNRDLADVIARDTGASAEQTLYGDTLGPSGSPGDTYAGMLAANADAIVRGLSGGRRGCPL